MSSEVKRYTICPDFLNSNSDHFPAGQYVLYSDFDRVAADLRRAREALQTQSCVRPSNGQPLSDGFGYVTVGDCVMSGNCGCDCRAALSSKGTP